MEYPKSLMFVLGLLAIGFCSDVAAFLDITDTAARLLIGVFFVGRIAAMWGIVSRKMIGWWFTVGYLLVLLALSITNPSLGIIIIVICLLILVSQRGEFE